MQKKTRTEAGIIEQVSANDNTAIPSIRPAPKKFRARCRIMRTGVEGWTENDILRYCRLSSGRNYATELIRLLGINLERIQERNPDGIGAHLRYRFVSCGDVLRVIQLVNHNATTGGYRGLSQSGENDILSLYPDAFNAA